MRRFGLSCFAMVLGMSVLTLGAMPASVVAVGSAVRITRPYAVVPDQATAIRLTFPGSVAAVDGRLLFDASKLELIGVAPVGGGTGLRPVSVLGGAAFGAYDLQPVNGVVRVDLVVVPTTRRVAARVAVESTASRTGRRLTVGSATRRSVAGRTRVPGLAPAPTIGRRDVAIARGAWEEVRLKGAVCGTSRATRSLDVDRDGCADIVDVQALRAARGRPGLGAARGGRPAAGTRHVRAAEGLPGTLTVDSTADTTDAHPGDGICATEDGDCTLRAAITEAEWLAGDITIAFDLDGPAPVTIRIGSRLPYITKLGGSLTIDGYSQPGSAVNTAEFGSNAVPGVRIRGNGFSAGEVGLFITSGHNLVRGLVLSDLYRGIFVDGPDATGTRILGNWIGFDQDGSNDPKAAIGVAINSGATDTRVGSADRADRNVIGNFTKAIDQYGRGTRGTVIQGNLLCIAPGGQEAECSVGVDHDFGPRDGLIGGDGPGELNVIGPTRWEGIELSHGWSPDGGNDSPWRITGNRVIGNWIGFRKDGRYDKDFRSGHFKGTADSTGVHIWDGANDNLIARNHVASHFDGIRIRTSIARRNEVIGNVIGVSPHGEKAPLSGWGISLSEGLKGATVSGNVIRNAKRGGVGLLSTNVAGVRISDIIVGRTSGPAIRLARNGSKGANHLVAAPRVSSARMASGDTVVRGTGRAGATVEVYRSSRAAGKPGLPARYLGSDTVASDGSWRVTVTGLSAGDRVTALQIRPNDDTSAMSAGVAVKE